MCAMPWDATQGAQCTSDYTLHPNGCTAWPLELALKMDGSNGGWAYDSEWWSSDALFDEGADVKTAAFNKPVSTVRTPRRPGSASCTRASVEPKKDLRRGPRSGDADPADAVSATSSSSASARRSRIGTSDIRVRATRPLALEPEFLN